MTSEPEKLIYLAGRTTVGGGTEEKDIPTEKRAREWIKARIEEGHESVLEHASVTVKVSGISRLASHQLVRHRIASYTQKSQRYVEDEVPEFIVPETIKSKPDLLKEFQQLATHSVVLYRKMRTSLVPKEDARYLLLGSITTEISITMNFRALRNFLKLRTSEHAQWEIRHLAKRLLIAMKENAPSCFNDIEVK